MKAVFDKPISVPAYPDIPVLRLPDGTLLMHQMDWIAFNGEPGFEEERQSRHIEIADHDSFKKFLIEAREGGL